jgi:hypothetical protein
VPEASAEKLSDYAREAGAAHSAVIGRVSPKSERAIVLRG